MNDVADKPVSATPADRPQAAAAPLDHAAIRTIVIGIMLAMFLSALEQTIVAPALPTIGRSLSDAENLSWVVTSYLLAATAVTPLFGKLSDIYGRRSMMLISVIVFIVGSVACALAPTMWTLIAARGLQGIGGGGILPLAHTIIADLVSPRERPRYQAYASVMFMGASIVGPVAGGILTDYMHWTLIFWINLPLGLVALVLTDRTLRRLPRHERPHRLDLPGGTLMVGAALALMMALSWGGSRFAWLSWPILSLVAGSALLWLAFALRLATAREPFIPLTVLRDPVVAYMVVVGFCSIGVLVGISIFLPMYFQLVMGLTPSRSGALLIVFLAAVTAGSFIASRLIVRLVHYRRVPMVGLIIGIAMLLCFAFVPGGLSELEVALLLGIGGAGTGVMYPVTTIMVQNVVALHQMGTATGVLNFFRQLGGAIVVALFGAIVLGGSAVRGHGVPVDVLAGGGDVAAMAGSFRILFLAAAGILVVGLAALLRTEERPLRGTQTLRSSASRQT